MKVIKRDSTEQEFNVNKIIDAIEAAMIECDELNKEIAKSIAREVTEIVEFLFSQSGQVSVESIQDLVEEGLMKENLYKVAKRYILYRQKRKEVREFKGRQYEDMIERVTSIMAMQDIQNANANVDESSFSGRNKTAAEELLKQFALNYLMIPEVAQAHREGVLYTHDLDNYSVGMFNCSTHDFTYLFKENKGFQVRLTDVREPSNIMTFCQLVAVVFQLQSQCQFGGIGANKLDWDAAPYIHKTYVRNFKRALQDRWDYTEELANSLIEALGDEIHMGNEFAHSNVQPLHRIALRNTIEQTRQACESLFHNLGTLESRQGSQVPFTSVNLGTCTSPEGRLFTRCMLECAIDGVGKHHRTAIFPILIFQYRKGINTKPGEPNYDLKQLAIKALSKRYYPNFANTNLSWMDPNSEETDPDCFFSTMGCRTLTGYDINGRGWHQSGRGNIAPATINLVDIAIRCGICLGEREQADIERFWKELDGVLELARVALLDRYEWIVSQKAKSGKFTYENKLMRTIDDRRIQPEEEVRDALKHGTLAIGYIGIAEMCKALFGVDHYESQESYNFAYSVVKHIREYADKLKKQYSLNFSCYATPAENLCKTLAKTLRSKYGLIEGVTDRKYLTNSHHVPVFHHCTPLEKIDLEAPFAELANGGYICYVELDASVQANPKAIESLVDYAMSKDVAYLAMNFNLDSCLDCGYQHEIPDKCPVCGSSRIERLRRVTGYLSTDYHNFNEGKIAEVEDRVTHTCVFTEEV